MKSLKHLNRSRHVKNLNSYFTKMRKIVCCCTFHFTASSHGLFEYIKKKFENEISFCVTEIYFKLEKQ